MTDTESGDRDDPGHNLPHARGRRFATLDAYLAHLEELGKSGLPWYRRLEDGRYMRILRAPPGTRPEILTRAELAARYGFADRGGFASR